MPIAPTRLALALVLWVAPAQVAWAQAEPPPQSTAPPATDPPPPVAPPPGPVQVQSLAVLDLFSVGTGPGLGPDLWKGSSADLARALLPGLGSKPLSPAMADLARKLLTTRASGPEDGGNDPNLAAARASAILAVGDAAAADAILSQTRGLEGSAVLSQAAAEAALITGQDDKACAISGALTTGRDAVYWLRLRAFCQARAGQGEGARLTADLAEAQVKDAVFRRCITVMIAGAGDPGLPSARNGLDLAFSRRLGLDLAAAGAKAPAAIRNQLRPPPADPVPEPARMQALMVQAAAAAPASRPAQAAAAFAAALGAATPAQRAIVAALDLGPAKASPARLLALQLSAAAGAKGDVALLALAIGSDAGSAGPNLADRVAIVRALNQAGLAEDARAIAAEGLVSLLAQP